MSNMKQTILVINHNVSQNFVPSYRVPVLAFTLSYFGTEEFTNVVAQSHKKAGVYLSANLQKKAIRLIPELAVISQFLTNFIELFFFAATTKARTCDVFFCKKTRVLWKKTAFLWISTL
jgi:hypothetical protein